MAWWNILSDPLTKIAEELIDTPMEKAEASALKLKVLDPNGKMRRDIAKAVSRMYIGYIAVMSVLVITQAYGLGDTEGTKEAVASLAALFVPVTSAFTMITMASFGVNGINASKGQ